LKEEALPTLGKVAQLLRKYPESRVRIEGHTDNVGSARFNLLLSEARAYVVALELTRWGVSAQRMEVKGFGEARPIASNATEAGRRRNRRVEIHLLLPAPPAQEGGASS
jgi:outer membrane protein OmpA-like peptidoglycan-associated protein